MKRISYIIFLYFFFTNNLFSFPKEIVINLNPKNFGNYQKNIVRAQIEKSENIKNKYKKWIDGSIIEYNGTKKRIKLRITGDWKDHLNTNTRQNIHFWSSLYVKVVDDNFDGVTRFKLLLPKTRFGVEHIFWNNLMNYYGYNTLKMRLIKVTLNNISYQAIIEEVPRKEFLERNLIREVPIIEFDERIYWLNHENLNRF